MNSIYHAGELAVQARLGVQAEALSLSKGISATIQPAAKEFLNGRQFAIVATIDRRDRVWASLLTNQLGLVKVLGEQLVSIRANFDVLVKENLLSKDAIGLLAIDFANRRRLRLNGRGKIQDDDSFLIETQQVYFNCPKYIQKRNLIAVNPELSAPSETNFTTHLTLTQQHWIERADTFFIASYHPESGADASHRGGNSGFVKVLASDRLLFPDYAGNNMFNTLGNLAHNPNAGLLFIDFETGNTLQLTGKGKIIWEVERFVEFAIEQVIETTNPSPFRWKAVEFV